MKQKLFLLIILLFSIITPTYLVTQNIAQELQNLTIKLQDIITYLQPSSKTPDQPGQPSKPTKPTFTSSPELDFISWKNKCDELPKYDAKKVSPPKDTALIFESFIKVLDKYFTAMKSILENSTNWFNDKMPDIKAWNEDNKIPQEVHESILLQTYPIPFVPFVEKHTFKSTDIIAFHGDFHGDIHAFNNFIDTWVKAGYMDNNFKIIKDNFYIMFLGDYTDRGWYGAEIIYALLRVKLANLTQVFMVRGNHEDLNIIANYGFSNELDRKFNQKASLTLHNKITRFYNFLPMTIYLICPSPDGNYDVIQCCHGGIEIGYNPQLFLASKSQFAYIPEFNRVNDYNNIIKAQDLSALTAQQEKNMQNNILPTTQNNGFMWNDFVVDPSDTKLSYKVDRGFAYSKDVTERLLENWSLPQYTLRAIFRAHQHTPSDADPMKQVILNFNKTRPDVKPTAEWYKAPKADAGIAFLWSDSAARRAESLQDILVLTFAVSPANYYQWPYDAFGLLTLNEGYDNWNMKAFTATRDQYEKDKI